LHELGHFLGLLHVTTGTAVMNPELFIGNFTPLDIGEFCTVHDCVDP